MRPVTCAGSLGLLPCRGLVRVRDNIAATDLVLGMGNQYLANQMGSLSGLVDRYFQSFLMGGGISALGYVGLIVNNLSSLMTFREIYVVPLASEVGRGEKLARMLSGIAFISVPSSCFVIAFAEPIVQVLFERGKFTAADTTSRRLCCRSWRCRCCSPHCSRRWCGCSRFSTASPTAICSTLVSSDLARPCCNICWCSGSARRLRHRLGDRSATARLLTLFVAVLVTAMRRRSQLAGRPANAALAALIAFAALAVSKGVSFRSEGLLALIGGGGTYWVVIALGYFAMRNRLRRILGRPQAASIPDSD